MEESVAERDLKTEAVSKDELVAKIGEIAGKIWRHLNAEGEDTLAKISRELGERPERIAMAVGWLAREDKVVLTVKGSSTRVALKENATNY